MNNFRKVYINSYVHYQMRDEGNGRIALVEYGTGDPDDEDNCDYDLCPGMEQRKPFQPHEGRVVETFDEGEQVEFILGSYETKITKDVVGDKIHCADDLRYILIKPPADPKEGSRNDPSHR